MHCALAGQIERASDDHAVEVIRLPRAGGRAIAAGFRRQVHDHAAGAHAACHLGGHDLRCRPARNRCSAHHHIHTGEVFGQTTLLFGAFVVAELTRVAAFAGSAHAQVQKSRTQRGDLLTRFRPHIEAFHLRAQPLGGGDRLQAGHARADHQHLARAHGAGRGGQHRKKARRQLRGNQHRLVAGHAGLRAQHIHRLRARGARQALQWKRNQLPRGKRLRTRRVCIRRQHADHHRVRLAPEQRVGRRRLHAQHHLGLRHGVGAGRLRTGLQIRVIVHAAGPAGPRFDPHAGTERDQFLDRFRRRGHTAFAGGLLFQYQHLHSHGLLRSCAQSRRC